MLHMKHFEALRDMPNPIPSPTTSNLPPLCL